MNFADRAVKSCVKNFENGRLLARNVRDILSCDDVDVSPIEPFLNNPDEVVRVGAISIIGQKGNMDKLVELAKVEKDRLVLMMILDAFRQRPEGAEKIVDMLDSDDDVIFSETVEMFRRVGREDCLFGLLFSQDDVLVDRVKRYIDEQKRRQESCP